MSLCLRGCWLCGDARARSSAGRRAAGGFALEGYSGAQVVGVGAERERPFWQARYYDFNVHNERKRIEKLRYVHRNPVKRGLAEKPEDWAWSSFRHYATGAEGVVEIESQWTALRRGNQLPEHLRYQEKAG